MNIFERKIFPLAADSYKHGHSDLVPPGLQELTAYIEARKGRVFNRVRHFGVQGYLKKYLVNQKTSWADVDLTSDPVAEATELLAKHGTPLPPMMEAIWNDLGYFPLRIESLPEGVVVPAGVPLTKVRSTDPRMAPLATWIETQIIRTWYPTSVCTNSYEMLCKIAKHFAITGADPNMLPFMLHDFGARGATCGEAAAIGGTAHLVNSMGTDTDEALEYARNYYHSDCAGFSIPATEHSVTTLWGRHREREFYEMICNTYGRAGKMISVVIDSYDQEATIDLFCNELAPLVRETFGKSGGKLILRPDSGDPVDNVPRYIIKLGNAYGWKNPNEVYLKLPDYIGLIQGDGIDIDTLGGILDEMTNHGLRTDNTAFGSGGGLLQKVNRDTGGFAMKACHAILDGESVGVQKVPKSDPSKASKAGDVAVVINDYGVYESTTVDQLRGRKNELVPVYENGKLLVEQSLDEIRGRATFQW